MNYKHGLAHSRLDTIYKNMINRCYKPSANNFERYGGRGITVCNEWRKDRKKFYEWAKKSGYSDNLTIDRIDNEKGYSPDNCKWSTYKEQNNNRRSSRIVEAFGERKTLGQWSDVTGIKIGTIWARLQCGWDAERAVSERVRRHDRHNG